MFIPITPVGKPRMTQRDRWAKRPAVVRYYQFCDELRLKHPAALPPLLIVTFYLPMPKSWSKKKKAAYNGKPHQQKPDIDNLCKAVMDALAKDDSYIWCVSAKKYWTDSDGGIDFITHVDSLSNQGEPVSENPFLNPFLS